MSTAFAFQLINLFLKNIIFCTSLVKGSLQSDPEDAVTTHNFVFRGNELRKDVPRN